MQAVSGDEAPALESVNLYGFISPGSLMRVESSPPGRSHKEVSKPCSSIEPAKAKTRLMDSERLQLLCREQSEGGDPPLKRTESILAIGAIT